MNSLDPAEALRRRLQTDLRAVMKARDKAEIDLLRSVIAAIDNAGAVEAPLGAQAKSRSPYVVTGAGKTEAIRRTLTPEDLNRILGAEAAECCDAAAKLRRHGKHREADALADSAAFIKRYIST